MFCGDTPPRAAIAVMVVARKPSRSKRSRAAITTARRRARARSRRPVASYGRLTSAIPTTPTFDGVKLYQNGAIMSLDPSAVVVDPVAVVVRSIHAMADGERSDFDPLYHPRAIDHENRIH